MKIFVDIGNTTSVFGVFENEVWKTFKLTTVKYESANELKFKIERHVNLSKLKVIAVSTVVPEVIDAYKNAFFEKFFLLDSKSNFSFEIKPRPISSIGMDRLVNAEGALLQFKPPLIVIDSGTATTVCAISKEKTYLGGAIFTGLQMSLQALHEKTSLLPVVSLEKPTQVIGVNTIKALQSGVILGHVEAINGLIRRFSNEIGESTVVITGGIANFLKENGVLGIVVENLTLDGIKSVYEQSTQLKPT